MGETSAVSREQEGSEKQSERRGLLGEGPWGGGRAGAAGGVTNVGRGGESCERPRLASGLQLLPQWPLGRFGAMVAPWQVWSHGLGKERGVRAVHDC